MAFFVENLKYREKKKNSPNEDIETAMEKKNSKVRIKKKKIGIDVEQQKE